MYKRQKQDEAKKAEAKARLEAEKKINEVKAKALAEKKAAEAAEKAAAEGTSHSQSIWSTTSRHAFMPGRSRSPRGPSW